MKGRRIVHALLFGDAALILDFNAGLFVAYVDVFLLVIIWLLWYTDVRCCKAPR